MVIKDMKSIFEFNQRKFILADIILDMCKIKPGAPLSMFVEKLTHTLHLMLIFYSSANANRDS